VSTPTSTSGISPRTWRAAVIVFLTVLLTGTGLTGAAALWSVQGTVTTQVKTAFWIKEGELFPVTISAERRSGGDDWLGVYRGVELNWAPTRSVPAGTQIAYRVEGEGLKGGLLPNRFEPGSFSQDPTTATTMNVRITRPYGSPEPFQIRVTPIVNGIEGAAITQRFTINSGGQISRA
jgi:hypothetical protein